MTPTTTPPTPGERIGHVSAIPGPLPASNDGGVVDRAVCDALLHAGELGLTPGALAATIGAHEKRTRRATARLAGRGLVIRSARAITLTAAGRAELLAASGQAAEPGALDRALAELPSETLRGFVRLLLSVTVARHHLRGERTTGWLALIACGPSGTGKTLAGHIAARVLGLDPAQVVRLADAETEQSLWGRREQAPGGEWQLIPAVALSWPLLVLDELDKAPGDLRRSLSKLLQGEARVAGEGAQVLEIAPAVLVTMNCPPAQVRPEYRRRAVMLDTAPLRLLLASRLEIPARRLLNEPGGLPRLTLAELRPPRFALPAPLLDELRQGLRAGLTADGYAAVTIPGLELATLGRAGLLGCSLDAAVRGTVTDYLACAAKGEWIENEAERLADAGELVGARALIAQRLVDAERLIANVPPARRDYARGIRAMLADYRRRALESRTRASLLALTKAAKTPLDLAAGLLDELGRESAPRSRSLVNLFGIAAPLAIDPVRPVTPPPLAPLGYGLACTANACGLSLVGQVPSADGVALCPKGHRNTIPRAFLHPRE
jgi:hypothetical protein